MWDLNTSLESPDLDVLNWRNGHILHGALQKIYSTCPWDGICPNGAMADWLQAGLQKRTRGPENNKLDMRPQHTLVAENVNCILGCGSRSVASTLWKVLPAKNASGAVCGIGPCTQEKLLTNQSEPNVGLPRLPEGPAKHRERD